MKASANGSEDPAKKTIQEYFHPMNPRKNQKREDEYDAILRGVEKILATHCEVDALTEID